MHFFGGRVFRFVLLVILIGFISTTAYVQINRVAEVNQHKKAHALPADKDIPATSLSLNETNGTVPGNPENAERALRKIYQLWPTYSERKKAGQVKVSGFYTDVLTNPTAYGFQDYLHGVKVFKPKDFVAFNNQPGIRDIKAIFHNPDSRYADSKTTREHPDTVSAYQLPKTRPDGTCYRRT
jgi:hypothetical protein